MGTITTKDGTEPTRKVSTASTLIRRTAMTASTLHRPTAPSRPPPAPSGT